MFVIYLYCRGATGPYITCPVTGILVSMAEFEVGIGLHQL
jgi:hypothetical protein